MSDIILETKDLTYTYAPKTASEVTAICEISLAVERGALVGVIGHTGSGKSTLIEHFNGLKKATGGVVLLDGRDIWENKKEIRKVRFRVGVCFQYPEYQLFEETVYKDIAFGPKNMGLSDSEIDRRVKQVLAIVGLEERYLELSPFDLSGGEKRRVAIAGIMAMEPQVLVLDEPCAGLDPRGRATVLSMIKNYRDTMGSTVILVSHSMEDIASIAEQILVLNKGRLAFSGTVKEVFSHAEELTAMGLDIPQMAQLTLALRERGFALDETVYTVPQAREAILARLKKEGSA